MDSRFSDIFLQAVGAARASERQQKRHLQQQPVDLRVPVDAPSDFDVLSGRGQGVQRHPGNVKYRRLVSLHKGLYAGCPKADKAKISRGIVAAVPEFGGRFLELDERTGTYHDIGDKKARDKTSQALREGQKNIRQKLHGNKASESLLCSCRSRARAVWAEEYFGHSVQVMEFICKSYEGVPSQTPPSRRLQNPSPVAKDEEGGQIEGMASSGVQDGVSIEEVSSEDEKDKEQVEEVADPPFVAGATPNFSKLSSYYSSTDDSDLLDLLVDTLDLEFHPNLLV